MRVLREAVLARGDWSLLYDKLAISNTYSHAKNRNDPRPITLSKVAFLESGFSAVAILGGGWLQSPASDGPPWNCCIKKYFRPKHTFEGILTSQLIRFLIICNGMEDFHEATSILFKVLYENRHYSGRFLGQVKGRFLRNYRQLGNTLYSIGAALKCTSRRCQCCLYLDEKSHFSNTLIFHYLGD